VKGNRRRILNSACFVSSNGTIVEKSVGAIDARFRASASQKLLAAEAAVANGMGHGG